MKSEDSGALSARVGQWQRAGEVMDRVRREEIQGAETARALRNFTGAVLAELRRRPERTTSGLVEQQRWFRKLR
jgi:hypothetical protein